MVGFEVESLAGRFMTGRSESLEVVVCVDCEPLPLSPPDPGARLSTGRLSSVPAVMTAPPGAALGFLDASWAAFSSMARCGRQLPSATQLPFTCFGLMIVKVPVGSPKLCASYTVCDGRPCERDSRRKGWRRSNGRPS